MFALLLTAAIAAATPLTVDDYATMPSLSAPRFSPDGKRIAYVVTRAGMKESAYDADLWLIDADGRRNVQLTRSEGPDNHPRWSPDGSRLAFLSEREGRAAIWAISPDGGEAQMLTDEKTAVRNFEWSPDGKWIAFTMTDPVTREEEKRIKEKDDARVIGANKRHSHLHLLNVESGEAVPLTSGEFSISSFSWSPDSSTIVFDRAAGLGLDDFYRTDIWTVRARQGAEMRPLVARAGMDRSPRFSPDGTSVAFLSTGVHDWLIEHQIHVVPASGGTPRLVSAAYDRTPDSFQWSRDSRWIWFDGPLDSTSQLFRVSRDGNGFSNVSNWQGMVTDASLDPAGSRVVFVRQSLTSPPELFISSVPVLSAIQLTHHNDAYEHRALGQTTIVRWKNPKDGIEIEGLLTLPTGYEPGKRYPLLTFVHGGPASRFDQGFIGYLGYLYPPHVFASRGFAVLRPNPRGTGGYGTRFRQANRNDWGGMDWLDINAGIDKVIADGIADPAKLGLMGWSYGGFIASWAIGHSGRLQAISVGAPVVDLLSFHGTTDIRDFLPHYFAGPPQADGTPAVDAALHEMRHAPLDLELLRAHSPLWHLKKTPAAVLIQHGDADDRVPLSQGTMLYRVLDELGVDVTMVVYPRTPHVPREPKLRADVMRRNVDFFEKHVR